MENYSLGKDADNHPIETKKFYIHTTTGRVIQVPEDAARVRVIAGQDGEFVEFLRLDETSNYRPLTKEEIKGEIDKSSKRIAWLQSGLSAMLGQCNPPNPCPNRKDAIDGEL